MALLLTTPSIITHVGDLGHMPREEPLVGRRDAQIRRLHIQSVRPTLRMAQLGTKSGTVAADIGHDFRVNSVGLDRRVPRSILRSGPNVVSAELFMSTCLSHQQPILEMPDPLPWSMPTRPIVVQRRARKTNPLRPAHKRRPFPRKGVGGMLRIFVGGIG